MTAKETSEKIKRATLDKYGITVEVSVYDDGTGVFFVIDSKQSADKLNDVWSKIGDTTLEKNPRREKWYLSVKNVNQ